MTTDANHAPRPQRDATEPPTPNELRAAAGSADGQANGSSTGGEARSAESERRSAGDLGAELDLLLEASAVATPEGFGDDVELIQRARQDPEAFGLLYERYVDRVYAYIYHRVGNTQDAEDLTARTFHRALGSIHGYEERGLPFAAWLFRIAHNLVANWHRDRSRRRFLSLDRIWSHRSEGDDPERELEKKETHDALWEAINELPAERRDLLIYKFGIRLSNLEIGETMNKSESAVKSLYFRTLATLRKELESRGWGLPSEDAAFGLGAGDDADE